jgi:hypothetical protein
MFLSLSCALSKFFSSSLTRLAHKRIRDEIKIIARVVNITQFSEFYLLFPSISIGQFHSLMGSIELNDYCQAKSLLFLCVEFMARGQL